MLFNARLRWLGYVVLILIVTAGAIKLAIDHPRHLEEEWMKWRLYNTDIVVSLTTTPHRIDQLQYTLQSLYNQNINVKAIYVNIPYVFKRDNLAYKIPAWLQQDKRVTILRTEDYGPATKILGVLEKGDLAPDTIIISVDDDVRYPSDLVLRLAYKSMLNPGTAIGVAGVNMDYDANGNLAVGSKDGLVNIMQQDAYTNALQGVGGIAYRRSFFKEDIFNIVNAPKECINSDDLYISFYLAQYNIPRQVLSDKYLSIRCIDTNNLGRGADALRNQYPQEIDRHRMCMAYLHQQEPGVNF